MSFFTVSVLCFLSDFCFSESSTFQFDIWYEWIPLSNNDFYTKLTKWLKSELYRSSTIWITPNVQLYPTTVHWTRKKCHRELVGVSYMLFQFDGRVTRRCIIIFKGIIWVRGTSVLYGIFTTKIPSQETHRRISSLLNITPFRSPVFASSSWAVLKWILKVIHVF